MATEPHHQVDTKQVALKLHESKMVGNIRITYVDYGHEHVSDAPDSPSAATVGTASFLLADAAHSETVTLYYAVNQPASQPVRWRQTQLRTISVSDNQQEVVLEVMPLLAK